MNQHLANNVMPHGFCYGWQADVVWLHVVSDAVIAAACFSMVIALLYGFRQGLSAPYSALIMLLTLCIALCGLGHLLQITAVWWSVDRLQGWEKALTAVFAVAMAVKGCQNLPKGLALLTKANSATVMEEAANGSQNREWLSREKGKRAALAAAVAGMSQEVNTPLGIGVTAATTLQAMAHDVRQKMAEGSLKKSDLERFLSDAEEASALVHQSLLRASDCMQSFKQVALDQSSGARRAFNLSLYLEDILCSIAPMLRPTTVKMTLDCAQEMAMDSYPGALAQVISHLVSHSLTRGGLKGQISTIHLRAQQRGRMAILDYRADGIGTQETQLEMGGDLGLTLVKHWVQETLHGRIRMQSERGQGLHFHLEIPLRTPEPALLAGNGHSLNQRAAHAQAPSGVHVVS